MAMVIHDPPTSEPPPPGLYGMRIIKSQYAPIAAVVVSEVVLDPVRALRCLRHEPCLDLDPALIGEDDLLPLQLQQGVQPRP